MAETEERRPGVPGAALKSSTTTTSSILRSDDAAAELLAAALIVDQLGGEIIEGGDPGPYAIELAANGWAVFPLRGKVPAISKRIGGAGVLDATTDIAQIATWWAGRYSNANIGVRVPPAIAVLDIDPRHGGDATVAELQEQYGPLPRTLTVWSGRGDGGRHLYFHRPFAPLSVKGLPGIDLKTHSGYVVAPPSRHPDTGQPYRWEGDQIASMPHWLARLLSPAPAAAEASPRQPQAFSGDSIADSYSAQTSWRELLPAHGWSLVHGDGDSDGSCWRHPAATSPVSGTIKHSCLFVYSPNTPFPVTETENPRGVTRFRALAILDHDGDLSAAARALRERAR